MPPLLSLQHILSLHSKLLLVDAASALVQVGLLRRGEMPIWQTSEQEAGIAVFSALEQVLHQAELTLDSVDGFIFCEGPGSVLGIRTTAVALRTWNMLRARPIYTYNSLTLSAAFQKQSGRALPFAIIADARRETWHQVAVDSMGTIFPVARLSVSELSGVLCLPAHFRHWATLPPGTEVVSYQLSGMFAALIDQKVLRPSEDPDAFLHEAPSYQTWTPHVHRAPS